MTWTTPTDRATGALITAAIWNQSLGASGNVVEVATARRASVTCSGPSIPNDAYTAISWDGTDTYDPSGWHDPAGANPSRITVDTAGIYLVRAQLGFLLNATGHRGVALLKNGATLTRRTGQPTFTSGGAPGNFATVDADYVAEAAANDYFQVEAYQNSGGALLLTGTVQWTWFQVTRMGIL